MKDNINLYIKLTNELDNALYDLEKCFIMCGELDDFFNMPNATKENRSWIVWEHKRVYVYYQILTDYIFSLNSTVGEIIKEIEVLSTSKEE